MDTNEAFNYWAPDELHLFAFVLASACLTSRSEINRLTSRALDILGSLRLPAIRTTSR
jgi:hypothetical protein